MLNILHFFIFRPPYKPWWRWCHVW